jgi:methylglutaconyl-CoA hydratase
MAYSTLKLDWEDTIALLTFNRPEKRNALSTSLMEEILAALFEIEASSAQAAIFTGSGTAFCAGMDLEGLQQLASQSFEQNLADARRIADFFVRLYRFPKPLIAAVNGHALAGGCGIATVCDFTLAVPAAKLGYTEVRIGFMPALVLAFLVRQIGEKHARDLLLTGRVVDAAEAMRLGLVTEVVPREELLARARALAKMLADSSGANIRETKRLLLAYESAELDRQIELAIDASARIRMTEDFREGLAAFLEKRMPKWTGK